MKIGIFQDIHANLPAFRKAIEKFDEHNCSKIYHVGDLIGIGPYPKEVMELATSMEDIEFIMGNHDYWYAFGLPDSNEYGMSDEEVEHQEWTHHQVGVEYRSLAQDWKFVKDVELHNGMSITFQHYGYNEKKNWFKSYIKYPDADSLDQLFDGINSEVIFYGHHHESSDITGNCRYVNLGSAGCHNIPEVRVGILEISDDGIELEKLSVHYDDNGLMEEFENRNVPARDFIKKSFITRS